jgi:hypothetical protein
MIFCLLVILKLLGYLTFGWIATLVVGFLGTLLLEVRI